VSHLLRPETYNEPWITPGMDRWTLPRCRSLFLIRSRDKSSGWLTAGNRLVKSVIKISYRTEQDEGRMLKDAQIIDNRSILSALSQTIEVG